LIGTHLTPDILYRFAYRTGDEMAIDTLRDMMRGGIDTYRALVLLRGHDEPIAIGGICRLWPGVGEGFLVISETVRMNAYSPLAREIHGTAKAMLDRMTDWLDLHRVQMATDNRYPERGHWARHLGFKYEGMMKKYGPDGADYSRWGRVR
jgi:hypothetical protein